MNDKLLNELVKTVETQTTTIKDLLEICTILKDRVEALEEKVKRPVRAYIGVNG